jgi:hypothetical protein
MCGDIQPVMTENGCDHIVLLAMALLTIRSIEAISRQSVSVRRVPWSFPLGEKYREQIIGNLFCGGFVS